MGRQRRGPQRGSARDEPRVPAARRRGTPRPGRRPAGKGAPRAGQRRMRVASEVAGTGRPPLAGSCWFCTATAGAVQRGCLPVRDCRPLASAAELCLGRAASRAPRSVRLLRGPRAAAIGPRRGQMRRSVPPLPGCERGPAAGGFSGLPFSQRRGIASDRTSRAKALPYIPVGKRNGKHERFLSHPPALGVFWGLGGTPPGPPGREGFSLSSCGGQVCTLPSSARGCLGETAAGETEEPTF